jgi:hypothetical protein
MGAAENFGTRPLRLVDARIMARIFEVTDARGLSRESVRVPLAGDGDGRIHRQPNGVWEIVVPAAGPLEPFLDRLAAELDGAAPA